VLTSLRPSKTVKVERIFVNPDGQKKTKIWTDFRVAVAAAEKAGNCQVVTGLWTTVPGTIKVGEADISVLSPSAAVALAGVGGKTTSGRSVTANTLSGVLRIAEKNGAGLLLAADMDEVSLDEAVEHGTSLAADVLVFPHRGGLPGSGNVNAFVTRLMEAVSPKTVVFSNGRGRHDNPRPEIVALVHATGCMIACTQLSTRCRAEVAHTRNHIEPIRANGSKSGASCGGSMTFSLGKEAKRTPDALSRHAGFITSEVSNPMCRGAEPLPAVTH